MNKFQKRVIFKAAVVVLVTIFFVVGMTEFRNVVNRSEAMRAMEDLGQKILSYRKEHGTIPPQNYLNEIRKTLPGYARLGELHYRARWIGFEADDKAIVAYVPKGYNSLLTGAGAIFITLDGQVQWIDKSEFQSLLDKQQSELEKELQIP
ncbi:hypothetical protein ACFL3G_07790 [Planctomycetota bacterium]